VLGFKQNSGAVSSDGAASMGVTLKAALLVSTGQTKESRPRSVVSSFGDETKISLFAASWLLTTSAAWSVWLSSTAPGSRHVVAPRARLALVARSISCPSLDAPQPIIKREQDEEECFLCLREGPRELSHECALALSNSH